MNKYVADFKLFESIYNQTETFNLVTEDVGDWLHVTVDVISGVADTLVPGSGSVIDLMHAISYFIEAEVSEATEKLSFHLQGFITLASIVLIGPLQQSAISAKNYIKQLLETTLPTATASVKQVSNSIVSSIVQVLNTLLSSISTISSSLVKKIQSLMSTDFGKWVIGKFGNLENAIAKCTEFLTVQVPSSIKSFLSMLAKLNPTKTGATGSESAELLMKTSAKSVAQSAASSSVVKTILAAKNKADNQYAQFINKNQVSVKPI